MSVLDIILLTIEILSTLTTIVNNIMEYKNSHAKEQKT